MLAASVLVLAAVSHLGKSAPETRESEHFLYVMVPTTGEALWQWQALADCKARLGEDATLATVDSAEKQAELATFPIMSWVWIGGTDVGYAKDDYHWADGRRLVDGYTYWGWAQPAYHPTYHCVVMHGGWNAVNCGLKMQRWICDKPPAVAANPALIDTDNFVVVHDAQTAMTHYDALDQCRALFGEDATLAVVDSAEKQAEIEAAMNEAGLAGQPAHIDGTDLGYDLNDYHWSNGAAFSEVFDDWRVNEPSHDIEHCVITWVDYKWVDCECAQSTQVAVCQRPADAHVLHRGRFVAVSLPGEWYGFGQAQAYCNALGSSLASLHSDDENALVQQMLADIGVEHAWLGGQGAPGASPGWIWTNGKQYGYNKWAAGQPTSSTTQDFTVFDGASAQWESRTDNALLGGFVCDAVTAKALDCQMV